MHFSFLAGSQAISATLAVVRVALATLGCRFAARQGVLACREP